MLQSVSLPGPKPVERFFNKIKHCRRVATRFKLAANYLAFVQLASIRLWLAR
jgi:transposase